MSFPVVLVTGIPVKKFAVFSCELCEVMVEGGRRVWEHIWTHKHMEAAKQVMRDKLKLPEAKMNYAGPQECYEKKPKQKLFCINCKVLVPKQERIPHMNTNDHLVNNMKTFLHKVLEMAEEKPEELAFNFCQYSPTQREIEPSVVTKLLLDDVVRKSDGSGWRALEWASKAYHAMLDGESEPKAATSSETTKSSEDSKRKKKK